MGGFAAVTMVAIGAAGVYLTLAGGGFSLRQLPRACAAVFAGKGSGQGVSPFQAVSTALAATMGTGNVAGVAAALAAGGPGAVFWMWLFALFGMMTKYTEIVLAVRWRRRAPEGGWRGGPMYYLRDALGSGPLAGIFAVCCAAASFGIGNAVQVNSIADSLAVYGVPPAAVGTLCAAVCALVIAGGVRRIACAAAVLVPVTSAVYLAACAVVLWRSSAQILPALRSIFSCAFGIAPAAGGATGWAVSRAIVTGAARGIFSNEAGLGSAPIAHASAECVSPQAQGLLGIFEVFADTVVVCTVTALVILTSAQPLPQGEAAGAAATARAFAAAIGPAGHLVVAACMLCFGISSVIGWAHYGETALGFLLPGRAAVHLYRTAYIAVAFFSAGASLGTVWGAADILNSMMALPNIIGILLLSAPVLRDCRQSN